MPARCWSRAERGGGCAKVGCGRLRRPNARLESMALRTTAQPPPR